MNHFVEYRIQNIAGWLFSEALVMNGFTSSKLINTSLFENLIWYIPAKFSHFLYKWQLAIIEDVLIEEEKQGTNIL